MAMDNKKKQIVFYELDGKNNEAEYWKNKSPIERIYALETLRNQYLTDRNGIRQRLQRVFNFASKA